MKRNAQTPFTTVKANLGKLNRTELEAVADLVAGLLDALAEAQAETVAEVMPTNNPAPTNGKARGYIEHKMINGCGPYAYLRYWDGKTLKSHYIGKVETSQ